MFGISMRYSKELERKIDNYDSDRDIVENGGEYGMRIADQMIAEGLVVGRRGRLSRSSGKNVFDYRMFRGYCAERGIVDPSSESVAPADLIIGLKAAGLEYAKSRGGKRRRLEDIPSVQVRAIASDRLDRSLA